MEFMDKLKERSGKVTEKDSAMKDLARYLWQDESGY